MGNLTVMLLLINLVSFNSKAQSALKLEFIDDYPIKIDGGCNFFTFDSTKIASNKYVYVVSGDKIGFFKLNGKFIYVNRIERIKKTDGYTDRFSGSGYNIELDIRKLRKIGNSSADVSGLLKITKGTKKTEIKVHGINEDGSL